MASEFSHLFTEIDFFEDTQPKEGPLQMAVDEILLGVIKRPLLRVYSWKDSWVSFGYAQRWQSIQEAFPDRQLVRRWSGGGAVDHTRDWTFSLIVPAVHPFQRMSAAGSYYEIHLCLRVALSRFFENIQEVSKKQERFGAQCFLSPRHNDLWQNGIKVAGGAQRRCKAGLLHQGSIQNLELPGTFGSAFVSHLAEKHTSFSPTQAALIKSVRMAKTRYATEEWLKKL